MVPETQSCDAILQAWYGGESGYPSFEELDGRSLILTRSASGEALLQSALRAGAISTEALPISDVNLMQPAQARRKRLVQARVAACLVSVQPRPKMAGLDVARAARDATLLAWLRDFIGTLRRIIVKRR